MTIPETTPAPETPAKRVNFSPEFHAMFRYGSSKCAVILKNMVDSYDDVFTGHRAHKVMGNALAKVDKMLDLVTLKYIDLKAWRESKNLLTRMENGGFMEHYVYEVATRESTRLGSIFPQQMVGMFCTVVKEKINQRKAKLGVCPPKRGIDYTTADLMDWETQPYVRAARGKFVSSLRKNLVMRWVNGVNTWWD